MKDLATATEANKPKPSIVTETQKLQTDVNSETKKNQTLILRLREETELRTKL